jgi:hypothetical protein
MERIDAFLSERDDRGRMPSYSKVGIAAVVGNEDGAHHCAAELIQAMTEVGFSCPAGGATYWVGEAQGDKEYKDLAKTPEAIANTTAMLAANTVHLARAFPSHSSSALSVGRRIMIEGTYGFVYCSDNGFGMGVFTIKGEQFIGVDSGGVNYDGTAKEQEDGSIALDVMLVPPELETGLSRASQRPPHTRQFVTTLPPAFGNGKPQEISSVPGNVTVMIRQVRDDFLHPDVRPTLFDTHRLGAASDVYQKGHTGR